MKLIFTSSLNAMRQKIYDVYHIKTKDSGINLSTTRHNFQVYNLGDWRQLTVLTNALVHVRIVQTLAEKLYVTFNLSHINIHMFEGMYIARHGMNSYLHTCIFVHFI